MRREYDGRREISLQEANLTPLHSFLDACSRDRRKIARRVEASGGWEKRTRQQQQQQQPPSKEEVHNRKKAHKREKRERRRRSRGFRSQDGDSGDGGRDELGRIFRVRAQHSSSLHDLRGNLLSLAAAATRHPLVEAAKSLAQRW